MSKKTAHELYDDYVYAKTPAEKDKALRAYTEHKRKLQEVYKKK